jgi:putative PEP-CTERM system TPR-repeat lipoprotein
MALKNEAQAAEDLKRALALQPDYAPAVLAGAGLAVRAGRTDDAFALARQAQKQPALARVGLLMEADLLLQQQPPQPARALPLYEKAFALEKTPKLIQTIHRLQAQSGKEAEADARLAQWLKENPDDIGTSMYAAERTLMKKQYKPAIAQFEAILKKSPSNPIVLNNLAWAYQQVHDPKALETAEAAHKAGGDNPAVLDTLGAILTERGDARRAVELLTKAVAGAPDNPDMRLHLAQAQIKAGDKANARKELEKLVAKGGTSPRSDEAKELLRQL